MSVAELLLTALVRVELAASFAVLLVLTLRGPARRWLGAELAYRLWAVVPTAGAAGLFPSLSEFAVRRSDHAASLSMPDPGLVLGIWVIGIVAAAAGMTLSERRFRRLADAGLAGPAVMGIFWPRLVTPADFAERFTEAERGLIRRHERTHIARRDPMANLFTAMGVALSWFNPLAYVAAACLRLDQELACDAAVLESRPGCRRLYGATLLKAHLGGRLSPFACAWFPASRHPLETRMAMLSRPSLTLSTYLRGAAVVAAVAILAVLSVWGAAPAWAGPSFVWPEFYAR